MLTSLERARFAVIGGGLSGLTAAFSLRRMAPEAAVDLFESSDRLGGPLNTHDYGDFVWEQGADSFTTKLPWALELCETLGLGDQLQPTSPTQRRALVVCHGRLEPVPAGFVLMRPQRVGSVLTSRVLSLQAKLRLLREPFIKPHPGVADENHDESVASFAKRRLGQETFERLVQPLLGGIYVADAERLSLAATMPEFLEAERRYGSLWRAPLDAPTASEHRRAGADDDESADALHAQGARYHAFLAPRRGLSQLVDALASHLESSRIFLRAGAEEVRRCGGGQWRVVCKEGPEVAREAAEQPYDGILLAVAAPRAAKLLGKIDAEVAAELAAIEYASSAVVNLGYRPEQFADPLAGFGFVVPEVERLNLVAASFPGVKFANRSSTECVPIRGFVGGAKNPEIVDWDDQRLIDTVHRELEPLLKISGRPAVTRVARWYQAMPQYHVGHVARLRRIERSLNELPGCEVAGNSYEGVGIPQCVRSGLLAAERLVSHAQAECGATSAEAR
ncbi:MAG: protoporphyrinogen oxidase [Planctomycetales bacterium]|nr:protoporphyrinogen oxidase [Planctomycetales bacterium]